MHLTEYVCEEAPTRMCMAMTYFSDIIHQVTEYLDVAHEGCPKIDRVLHRFESGC